MKDEIDWLSDDRLHMMKPRKPIRRVSLKRQRELRQYRKLRDAFLADNPRCERCWERRGYPSELATCVHHWAGRRGKQLLEVKDFRASCDECNLWAKNHPREAREEKWIAPVGVYMT